MTGKSLTKQVVESLIPGERNQFVWCGEMPGFGVKVTPAGKKVFVYQYRNATRQTKRFTIGTFPGLTVQQARDRAREILAQVVQGSDPQTDRIEKRTGMTVSEFIGKYLEHIEAHLKPGSVATYRNFLDLHVLPVWGTKRMDSITHATVQHLHHSMRTIPYAANRTHAILRSAFNLAVKWGVIESNPTIGVKHFKEQGHERFLSQVELVRLFDVLAQAETPEGFAYFTESADGSGALEKQVVRCDPYSAGAIRLLCLTGARKNEIQTAQWAWVNWEQGRLDLPDSKTGKKSIYLPGDAVAVLKRLYAIRLNEYIIPGRFGRGHSVGVPHVWSRIRVAAGLPGVRLHDLRHSFASFLIAKGMSLPILGKTLGHTLPSTTQRYAHLSDDPLKAAVAIMDDVLKEGRAAKKSG
jgi:integrase